ncbi:hypothetical protein QBC34DRAFT_418481 [Podospora aff. communis PSN243]|uniref:Uncharacterized protein n=1 Tax=Podospora aff. communis PSN243 TaxID=3040156 RepID=A0AAV9G384_9PEZI|nr:hypothetical protein QBC34DRAFT_418481 [Podospora aff. communis PSN243]
MAGSSYTGGTIRADKLSTARADALYNEEVLRFVLLTEMLRDSGLCTGDIRTCLSKYVKSLAPHYRAQLQKHLPNTLKLDEPSFQPTVWGLSSLGRDGNLPVEHITTAMRAARLRLAEDPSWFSGPNGWFLWMASRLSRNFWFGEVETALWVADMARIRISMTASEVSDSKLFTGRAALLIREAWLSLFGLLWNKHNFENVCTCPAKLDFAIDRRFYKTDTRYTTDADASRHVLLLEEHVSDIVGFKVASLYSPDLGKDNNHIPYAFSSAIMAAHWRNETFLATRARLPALSKALFARTLRLIQLDNPEYKHKTWLREEKPLATRKTASPAKSDDEIRKQTAPEKPKPTPMGVQSDKGKVGKIIFPVVSLPKPLAPGEKAKAKAAA